MRLAAEQIRHILDTARRRLGDDSAVLLFGSRADDEARAGEPEKPIHRIARLTGVTLS